MEIFTFIVALIVIVMPVIDWYVVWTIFRLSREAEPANLALLERGRVATMLALATTIAAGLAAVRLFDLHPPTPVTLVMLSIILLLIGMPNLYWLYLYSRNKFRK